MILTIAGRELRSLFLSPLAWAILAVVQFILAYLFLAQIESWMLLQPRLAALEGAPGVADIAAAAGIRKHAFAPDHVEQKGEADGPEEDKAQHHRGDPSAFALAVEPGLGPVEPVTRM